MKKKYVLKPAGDWETGALSAHLDDYAGLLTDFCQKGETL